MPGYNIYDNALGIQDASNLGGVIRQLGADIQEIQREAREQQQGTDYVNRHPVLRLYIEQLVHLNGCGFLNDETNTYSAAYKVCQEKKNHGPWSLSYRDGSGSFQKFEWRDEALDAIREIKAEDRIEVVPYDASVFQS